MPRNASERRNRRMRVTGKAIEATILACPAQSLADKCHGYLGNVGTCSVIGLQSCYMTQPIRYVVLGVAVALTLATVVCAFSVPQGHGLIVFGDIAQAVL